MANQALSFRLLPAGAAPRAWVSCWEAGRGGWSSSWPRRPWGYCLGGETSGLGSDRGPSRPFPRPALAPSGFPEKFWRGEGRGKGVRDREGRGWLPPSPRRSSRTLTQESGRFPRGRLTASGSPVHFPFLLRAVPEHEASIESVPQSLFSLRQTGWGVRGCGGWQECLWEAWTANQVFPLDRHSDHVLKP